MDEVDNPTINSPYIGLQPYRVEDRKYFFGRERDSRVISSNLFAFPLTVLYGSSGVGKSSVLQAGVVPLLRSSPKTVVISFQRWPEKDPIEILKTECLNAIRVAGYEGVQVDTNLSFDEFLLQAAQAFHGTILVILDQFEEYFLYHSEIGSTFDAEFARAVNREEIDANFLIALREDSLSMLDRFRARIPNMLGNSLRLRHLDEKSAREAIHKPLEVYNQEHPDIQPQITIDKNLVDQLIKDVQAGKLLIGQGGTGGVEDRNDTADSEIRIEAPFLQLILTRLWNEEMRQGSNSLQLETLIKLGGAGKIVRTHLDNAMSGFPREEQEVAANIYRFLVTPSGTKIAYSIEDLAYYAGITAQFLEPVLERLAQGDIRILRRITLPGEPSRYEIYHDVLAPAILDWRVRYERDKELAEKRKELDQELAQKLNTELGKAREIGRKQRRTIFIWAFWGALVDFIILVVTLGCGSFLPIGGWVFTWGLRKLQPSPSRKQNILIILFWFIAHFIGTLFAGAVFNIDISNLGGDADKIWITIIRILIYILIALAGILVLASGPIGGVMTYSRIMRKEQQPKVVPSS